MKPNDYGPELFARLELPVVELPDGRLAVLVDDLVGGGGVVA